MVLSYHGLKNTESDSVILLKECITLNSQT